MGWEDFLQFLKLSNAKITLINLNFIISDPVDKAENTPNLPGNVASLVFFPSFLPFSFLLLFFLFFLTLFNLFYLKKIPEREIIKCSNFLWN